jgi:hypothetical protein
MKNDDTIWTYLLNGNTLFTNPVGCWRRGRPYLWNGVVEKLMRDKVLSEEDKENSDR